MLAGGLIWFAFWVQFEKIKTISDDIQKEQLDSQVRQQRSQQVLELGKELGNVEANQQAMKAMLVDKEDAVPFLRAVESVAAATGNTIKISVTDLSKIKFQSAKAPVAQESEAESTKDVQKEDQAQKAATPQASKPDFSGQLGFSIELTGNYRSFVDFLTKVENLPYFVRVYTFQAASAKTQTSQPAGSGAVQAPAQGAQAPLPEENKNIKTTLVVGVYTNEAK